MAENPVSSDSNMLLVIVLVVVLLANEGNKRDVIISFKTAIFRSGPNISNTALAFHANPPKINEWNWKQIKINKLDTKKNIKLNDIIIINKNTKSQNTRNGS